MHSHTLETLELFCVGILGANQQNIRRKRKHTKKANHNYWVAQCWMNVIIEAIYWKKDHLLGSTSIHILYYLGRKRSTEREKELSIQLMWASIYWILLNYTSDGKRETLSWWADWLKPQDQPGQLLKSTMYIKGIYHVKMEVPNMIAQVVLGDAGLDIRRFSCVTRMHKKRAVCVGRRERRMD